MNQNVREFRAAESIRAEGAVNCKQMLGAPRPATNAECGRAVNNHRQANRQRTSRQFATSLARR
jgi:hypothetical protein